MASAAIKFPEATMANLQQAYIHTLGTFPEVGGEVWEYLPSLNLSDYLRFLAPLVLEGKELPAFRWKGTQDHDSTSPQMWQAYERVKDLAASRSDNP
jgi:hypothetical protein